MVKGGILSRLRRGTFESFVLHAAGVGLLFLMHTLLAQYVGASAYGAFSYAVALAGMLGILVPLGWPTALMRFTTQYVEQRRWGLLRGAFQRAYQTTLAGSVVVSLLLLVLSYLERVPDDLALSLRYAALLLPLLAFVSMRRKALQALQKAKASIVLEEVLLPVLVISGVLVLGVATSSDILFLYAASAFVVLLLSTAWLWRSIPREGRAARPEFTTRAWMAVALPMLFGSLGQVVMNRTDVLLLGLLTDTETVGIYSAATRIATLNVFVLSAVNTIAAPMMAAAFHGGKAHQTKTILHAAMLLSALGALPAFALMVFSPQFLLGFFGPEFVEASLPLQILALGQFVNAATGPVGFALLMTGRERAFAGTMAVVAVGSVALSLAVIPAYGAAGAAAVTAASIIVVNVWQYLLARRAYA